MRFSNQLMCLGMAITPALTACDGAGPLDLGSRDFGPRRDAGASADLGPGDIGSLEMGTRDAGQALTAADFEGYYRLQSTSLSNGLGQPPQEIRRDGVDASLRGEFRFAATSASTARVSGKFFILQQNLLEGPIEQGDRLIQFDIPAVLEADRWVFDPDDDTAVYGFAQEDGQLILSLEQADPRNVNPDDLPRQFILVRGDAPAEYSVGQWDMEIFAGNGVELRGGVCTPSPEGQDFSLIQIDMNVAASTLLYSLDFELGGYSDPACTSSTTVQRNEVTGIFEEREDGALDQWLLGPNTPPQYYLWNVQLDADTIDLTQADCDPQPSCLDDGPTRMRYRRR